MPSKKSRVERDVFVDEVFNVAQLLLLIFKNKRSYLLTDIKEKLYSILNAEDTNRNSTEKESVTEERAPLCPKFDIPMVKHIVSRGENKRNEL